MAKMFIEYVNDIFFFKLKKILWNVTSENISNAMFDIIEIHFYVLSKKT